MCSRFSGPHMISSFKNSAALNSNPSREHVSLPGIRSSNNGKARQAVTLPSTPARTPSSSRFSRLQFPEFREFLDSILEGYEIIPYAYRCTAKYGVALASAWYRSTSSQCLRIYLAHNILLQPCPAYFTNASIPEEQVHRCCYFLLKERSF